MPNYQSAVRMLRNTLPTLHQSDECRHILDSQAGVVRHFQNLFNRNHLPQLTQSEFETFLSFKTNCHWTNLARKKALIFDDINLLRHNLTALIDDAIPIAQRYDRMKTTPGCGKAIISGILLVLFPKKYGVWNGTSETCLKALRIWPDLLPGLTEGRKYEKINTLLVTLARDVGTDLWTLDTIFWKLVQDEAI